MKESQSAGRRIWSDPLFFWLLGAIAATYVFLILAMLIADAAYVATSRETRPVTIDFFADGDGRRLREGDRLTDQFRAYGLTIGCGEAGAVATIIDSTHPPADALELGTPHVEFGGPGVGDGGGRRAAETAGGEPNAAPLGNVVVLAEAGGSRQAAAQHELVAVWPEPVTVRSVRWSGGGGRPVSLRLLDRSGSVVATGERAGPEVVLDQPGVARLVARVPEGVSQLAIELAEATTARVDLATGVAEVPARGMLYVRRRGVPQVAIRTGGTMVFEWLDPVRVDRLRLLNVRADGGLVRAWDADGQIVAQIPLQNRGANSVQTVSFREANERVPADEQLRVVRLEVELPCDAAVAQLEFTWAGMVRPVWLQRSSWAWRLVHNPITMALRKKEIQFSICLSLLSCTATAILSVWVAVPTAYLLSRHRFFGRNLMDALLDVPIVLPPLVVGLSLLILFQFAPRSWQEAVVYKVPAVVLAQFAVACAFAVRTMRATFDQIDARREQVALTLGCSRLQAFALVVVPEAGRGIITAGTLAWARALGEFGPLLVFAGATRGKTEVLSTTVFLELSVGDLGAAVAVSLIMVVAAVVVLIVARVYGTRQLSL